MRTILTIGRLSVSVLAIGGCAAIRHLDEYTTSDGLPPPAATVVGEPTAPTPAASPLSPAGGCKTNRECTDNASAGGVHTPSMCLHTTGACAPLVTASCARVSGDYLDDRAVVIGTLLSGAAETALERAVRLAAEEINSAVPSGLDIAKQELLPGRPLVVLACDDNEALSATDHLVNVLHVPAIIGPMTGEDVVDVTQQVSAKGGTLVMTPTAVTSTVSNLADSDLTWRTVPSDTQRAKLVVDQINALETLLRSTRGLTTVKLGVVHPTNALGESAYGAVSGKLILNGRFSNDPLNQSNVSVDPHPVGAPGPALDIATRYASTFRPDIVFVTSDDEIASFVVPFEQALRDAGAPSRPYYVMTDAVKRDVLLSAIGTTLPSDIKRRIRGVGVRPAASSVPVLTDFVSAFQTRYGEAPTTPSLAGAALAYDATYAVAYALASKSDLPASGAAIAQGLRALGVGETMSVGAGSVSQVFAHLATGTSVSLRGTFSPLVWDASGDIRAGDVEVWCIGTSNATAVFGSSGLAMDVATQVVGGAFVQCQ